MQIGLRTIKTALGAVIAMVIAYEFHLSYWATAGIVTILSVQNTTKYSFRLAGSRIVSAALAFLIATLSFRFLGFNPWAYGIFLLIFIPLAMRLQLQEGIVVSAVLVTHFLLQRSYSWHWISNELALLLIGVGVALVFNLFMPSLQSQIKGFQRLTEDDLTNILKNMQAQFTGEETSADSWTRLGHLLNTIRTGREWSNRQQDNQLFIENDFYRSYFEMRRNQYEMLRQMQTNLDLINLPLAQSEHVEVLLEKAAATVAKPNAAKHLVKTVVKIQSDFDGQPLPTTREEFENRAHLYLFLLDFETLLTLKADFYEKVTWVR
ncbi:aromatic acid exporter family protein [Loigolactobacillus backii]|uniref:Uncharacterized protein n=1 Tax=Loigolactobacillus backii TaxID=375175 RepID=A0A192H5G5_9LACO|nr:aromatic acid exporter family protein [Loigolactobacillus backii]ANK60125.1 hypothetical protein AYR52_07560 [Loigolactobacillus backii]ANK63473.1 hypothetical protein AYR53_12290 [Loigolactobacillus backii]ANK66492.1 hypothetical protein AYR55_01500 [Loigolactobacillus backii]ANK69523.1 hypothetical protein AYR56_04715 [Loigolactobacillus backii]MDA5387970.1 aromatic acid exporter family protein [Loigolactobacillus backii]